MQSELAKLTVADIGAICDLRDPARALLTAHPEPTAYVEALRSQGLGTDGLEFVAHWLPKREAIWWGCLCVWHVSRPTLPPAEEAALRAVVRWVREPAEPRRQSLQAVAETAGSTNTPAGGLAYAAWFSGGSLAPPDAPVVAPPAQLTAQTLAKVLIVAALYANPERADEAYRHFLELALEVAEGKNRWN